MLVKEAVQNAAKLLELNIPQNDEAALIDAETKLLTTCADMILNEMAAEYFSCVDIYSVESDGIVYFEDFPKEVFSIIGVSMGTTPVNFKVYGNKVVTTNGSIHIKYTYTFGKLDYNAEVDYPEHIARVAAYGIAAEYCLIKALYDEAVMFQKRFREAIQSTAAKKFHKLKARSWL